MVFWIWALLIVFLKTNFISGIELTFELYDNARDCFYEVIEKNISVTLEYQVVTGGQYDVDVVLEGPNGDSVYQQYKSQFDSHTFVTAETGSYAVCFSNEFSTFSHKVVYMDFIVGEEKPLPNIDQHITVMTLMESSLMEIHQKLNTMNDFQTHHRLREATSRKRAEDLNQTVFWWCLTETFVILITMVGQVLIVKNFFSDTRTVHYGRKC
ncbi:hypothetical protein V9T40_005209 [Parthenolecanium corni]|uniref:GOLD domain-containing protein n=1 Tax=Parthenolecanium corni TaxID=536013 RepID=A0AAN9TFF4_9HEMI